MCWPFPTAGTLLRETVGNSKFSLFFMATDLTEREHLFLKIPTKFLRFSLGTLHNLSHVPSFEAFAIPREMEGSYWSSDDHLPCPDPGVGSTPLMRYQE